MKSREIEQAQAVERFAERVALLWEAGKAAKPVLDEAARDKLDVAVVKRRARERLAAIQDAARDVADEMPPPPPPPAKAQKPPARKKTTKAPTTAAR